MYFPGDISSLLIVGNKRKRISIVHFSLSLSPTEIGQKWIWKAFVDNYCQLLSEENNRNFEIFNYQRPLLNRFNTWFIEIFQGSISERSSLALAFSLQTWTLQPPEPGVSFLLFLGCVYHLPPSNSNSAALVGLYCPTSLCYLLYASDHSQQSPLLYYSDSEVSYLYDFPELDALWDQVPDLRSVKMVGVLWNTGTREQERSQLHRCNANKRQREGSCSGRMYYQGTLSSAKPFLFQPYICNISVGFFIQVNLKPTPAPFVFRQYVEEIRYYALLFSNLFIAHLIRGLLGFCYFKVIKK